MNKRENGMLKLARGVTSGVEFMEMRDELINPDWLLCLLGEWSRLQGRTESRQSRACKAER